MSVCQNSYQSRRARLSQKKVSIGIPAAAASSDKDSFRATAQLEEPNTSAAASLSKQPGTDKKISGASDEGNRNGFPSVKEIPQPQPTDMDTTTKDSLRLKLRQILGGAPATDNTDDHDAPLIRPPRQNSDTIETDSEDAALPTKTPVTRSRPKKRAPARPRVSKPKSLPRQKQDKQEAKDIFSFSEKCVPSQPCAPSQDRRATDRNISAKRSCGIKPGDLLLPVTDFKSIHEVMTGADKPPPAQGAPSRSIATSPPAHGSLNDNVKTEVNVNQIHVGKDKCQISDAENSVSPAKSKGPELFGDQSPLHHDDVPTFPFFNMRRTVLNAPVDSLQLDKNEKQHGDGSAQASGQSIAEDRRLPESSPATKKGYSDSTDATVAPEEMNASSQESSLEGKDLENELFTPERGGSDSTEDLSSADKAYSEEFQMSPEIGLVEKPMFPQNQRHRRHGVDLHDFSPDFPVQKGGTADDVLMEHLDGSEEDGFARVISLLGLALEKVKNKMSLVTNKRCSDILISVAEEIQSQLQTVESQIQTDLESLTDHKTSKRKHLETSLQEQQEKLKAIHERFKEEIHRYLQDCRGAVEGLEAQHVELKRAVERQKASHRKLLLQTEVAVETHLADAQSRIMSVHKLGRRRMQQLKVAIAECLKAGISS